MTRYTMDNTNEKKTAQRKPVVAITTGDPNGIGYEVMLKSLAHPHILEICTPVIYGNLQVMKKHLQLLDKEMQTMQFNLIGQADQAEQGKINLIKCYADDLPLNIGTSTQEGGLASYQALARACEDIKQGLADALVTAPINKENIQSEQFQYSGHTEYLTHIFSDTDQSLMMMVSEQMRIALVSNHVAISKVPLFITEDNILQKLTLLNKTLQSDFRIRRPRIAVLALNPHAGDGGLLGTEEQNIIIPAIRKAKEAGIMAFGPYSADGFFGAGDYTHFDAILGMYHDQGLIPFKTLNMQGVNFTAGLRIIRTSPDHGTAYSIAGKNGADATSFRNALYMAIDLVATRDENKELEAKAMHKETKE